MVVLISHHTTAYQHMCLVCVCVEAQWLIFRGCVSGSPVARSRTGENGVYSAAPRVRKMLCSPTLSAMRDREEACRSVINQHSSEVFFAMNYAVFSFSSTAG